ncbi:hypothetical protein [Paraburkholderia hiiakae]|nr:hypothetical protein [Paraburkholderia hiiakae]
MVLVELGLLPACALAQQTPGPCTRAEVLQHLYDLESEGFWPTQASNLRFPLNIEAAEARLAARQARQTQQGDDPPPPSVAGQSHCFR